MLNLIRVLLLIGLPRIFLNKFSVNKRKVFILIAVCPLRFAIARSQMLNCDRISKFTLDRHVGQKLTMMVIKLVGENATKKC